MPNRDSFSAGPAGRPVLPHPVRDELAWRLDRDRPLLREFNGGADLGPLTRVRPVGDPHAGGRRVTVLEFGSGVRLVYKPRPVAIELIWARVIAWVNRRAGSPLLAAPPMLDRGTHGWAAFLDSHPPVGEAARRHFHRRAGVLLSLLDILEVRDAHVGNLIAWNDYPVVVDAEAMAHPRWSRFAASPSLALTGFLPGPEALDGRAGILAGVRPGDPPAAAFVAAIVAGYRMGYDLLKRHRRQLTAGAGPLSGLRRAAVRVLLRPTRAYACGIRQSRWPVAGLPGLELPADLEATVVARERRALRSGDIPVFHVRGGGRILTADGDRLGPCVQVSGAGMIRRRLERLTRMEREEMVGLICGALTLDALAGHQAVVDRGFRYSSQR